MTADRKGAWVLLAGLALAGLVPPTGNPAEPDGKLDSIQTRYGHSYEGAVLGETPSEIRFQMVRRVPGRAVVLVNLVLPRGELKRIDKLNGPDRKAMLDRLASLNPTGKLDDPRVKGIDLKPAVFEVVERTGTDVRIKRNRGLSYSSDYFELISDAHEEIVWRVAVRLEQIYAAYRFWLPPSRPARPNATTAILLYQTWGDYQARLRGRTLFNPVWYSSEDNEIVCGADLGKLGQLLADLRKHHEELLDQVQKQEALVKQLPKGEVQERGRKVLDEARTEIAQTVVRNQKLFEQATAQLFRSLYHEAFHAYLANFVHPPIRGEVPRWLNEGLAQVFEEAAIDDGVLHVGPVPAARLERTQALARAGQLVPLPDLFRAGSGPFIVAHGQERQLADRFYLTSWAAVHYLMFQARRVGTPNLDEYVAEINGRIDAKTGKSERADPIEAAGRLFGKSVAELEKELPQYVLDLQSDGTRRK
jgi:hypothetical protein